MSAGPTSRQESGSYRQTVEAYMRRRNEALPPDKRVDPKFLDSLFDLGTPVFSTVAGNFDDLGKPGTKAERVAELRQEQKDPGAQKDPGPWLEEARDRETGPQRLVLDYIAVLRKKLRGFRPPGRKATEQALEIDAAYVPLTTAAPRRRNPDEEDDEDQEKSAALKKNGQPVEFRRLFEHSALEFWGARGVRVLGGPGYGKTTASRQTAWRLSQRYRLPGLPRDVVPLWLPFSNLKGAIPAPVDGFAELESFLITQADSSTEGTGIKGTGEAILKSGRPLLWILDGFDEIANKDRQDEVCLWIRQLAAGRDKDYFLVTSRYFGEERERDLGLEDCLLTYHLNPLNDNQQEVFVGNYLKQTAPKRDPAALLGAIRNHERHSAEERQMSRNPLLLSLMCYVFAEKGCLPGDWDDLFEDFLKLFLNDLRLEVKQGQRQEIKFAAGGARKVLERLAWSLQCPQYRQSAAERELRAVAKEALDDPALFDEEERKEMSGPMEFLRLMREHAGLLAYQGEKETNHLGFLLRPIPEYLAACYAVAHGLGAELARMFNRKPEDQREVVRLGVKRSAGNEQFRTALFAGLLEGGLDGNDDIFLGRLVALAREEAVPAFVGVINKAETDRWRQGRLLGFVRKFRTPELKEAAEKLKGQDETKWHALEILTEPSQRPPEEGDIWVEQETGMCLVRVKGGKFEMGEGNNKHWVEITKDYWMGKCAVTRGEYAAYLKASRKAGNEMKEPEYWSDPRFNGEYQPVVGVSWEDAKGFCEWLEKKSGVEVRLPTEAEWERACRADSIMKYCFGDSQEELKEYAWFGEDVNTGSTHVGGVQKPNGWGLYDMRGNVWEWCWDWYGNYPSGLQVDPVGPANGSYRVYRGGCWGLVAGLCRSARRSGRRPDNRDLSLGFRLAVSSTPGR